MYKCVCVCVCVCVYVCVCVCVCKQAKDMITLVNKFAAKLEDKKGALTEDEVSSLVYTEPEQLQTMYDHVYCTMYVISQTIQFKSYLLSVGIANPVTR